MFHSNPLISASLAVALAAGAAGVFTVATSTASPQMDRPAAPERWQDQSLSSIIFDARPIAGSVRTMGEPTGGMDLSRSTMTEQILPQQKSEQPSAVPAKGCESGLSPDLNPTARPVRCVT